MASEDRQGFEVLAQSNSLKECSRFVEALVFDPRIETQRGNISECLSEDAQAVASHDLV